MNTTISTALAPAPDPAFERRAFRWVPANDSVRGLGRASPGTKTEQDPAVGPGKGTERRPYRLGHSRFARSPDGKGHRASAHEGSCCGISSLKDDGTFDLGVVTDDETAAASTSSSVPGSERANMPLCFMLSSASMAKRGKSGLNTDAIADSETLLGITTATVRRDTRRASANVRTLSSANWKELKPVTTSKESLGQGNASTSPTRKSPSGLRSAAISISSSAASMPLTLAPSSAAKRAKRPAPQPQSNTLTPAPTFARSSTCSYAGVPQPAGPSQVSAQSRARAPNSGPQRAPLPTGRVSSMSAPSSAFVRFESERHCQRCGRRGPRNRTKSGLTERGWWRDTRAVRTYGQYCPIARASEILAERWTPIIVRNLLAGCTTYSQISAGAPGLSRSLLTQRLRLLERVGVVEVQPKPRGRGVVYQLSDAGRDLREVMSALGAWGERWLELGDEHTNPRLVLWAWCTAYLERLPDRRVVVRFEFSDQPADNRRVWLLVDHGDAEVCKHDPGFEEDLIVETDARTLAYWHLKRIEWADAVRCGRIRIKGPGRAPWRRTGYRTTRRRGRRAP